jgi:hypothetical protein
MFRRALRRDSDTTLLGCEEALYNLAIACIDSCDRRRAIPLLERANKDDDYPEAASLLAQIRAKAELIPRRCRRDLRKDLLGHANCPQHSSYDRFAASNRL